MQQCWRCRYIWKMVVPSGFTKCEGCGETVFVPTPRCEWWPICCLEKDHKMGEGDERPSSHMKADGTMFVLRREID